MATTVARLQAVLSADTRDFERGMRSSESRVGKFAKMAALGFGAAGAAGAIAGLKIGWDEFNESVKATAQTNAVIKSTGGVANVTAKQVDALAGAIMRKSGIDDEAVKSGENLLLTFTNVRNEAGRGNDIFNQATSIMADMSTALGQDMSSSAIQLGKALNDPIRGVSALRRVGVSFTKAQQEQIKTLVASGKTMDAQKLILRELNTEFGGSAEAAGKTLPGQLKILREQFNNVAGDLVAKMVPTLLRVTEWFQVHGPEIRRIMEEVVGAIRVVFTTVLIPAVAFVVQTIRNHWDQISANTKAFALTIQTIFRDTVAVIRFIWDNFGDQITTIIRSALLIAKTVVSTVLLNIRDVFRLIGDIIHGRWGEVWEDISGIVRRTLGAIVTIIRAQISIIGAAAEALGHAAWLAVRDKVNDIVDTFKAMPGRIADGIRAGFGVVKDAVHDLFAKALPKFVRDALGISSPSRVFAEIGEQIVAGAIKGITSKKGELVGTAKGLVDGVGGILGAVGGALGIGGGTSSGSGGLSVLTRLLGFASTVGGGVVTSTTGGIHAPNSYHYQGRAIDWAGSASAMRQFFATALDVFGSQIRELFYDPMGIYVKNGAIIRGAIGGHADHVHLALARGGIVTRPTRALIGESGPEAVIPLSRAGGVGTTVVVNAGVIGGTPDDIARKVADLLAQFQRRGGQLGFA